MAKETELNLIGEIALFSGLTVDERRRAASLCAWATYGPEVEILGESDESSDVFFVVRGEVAAKSYSASGREVTFTTMGAGQMFGEIAAIDGQPRSASIRTTASAVIARMSSAAFRDFLAGHPGVAIKFAEHLVRRIRVLSKRVFEYSTLSVRQRIRAELLRMCQGQLDKKGGASIDPAPTHYELATRLSTHREAVSRELSYLSSRKVIALHWRRIHVVDVARLRASVEASMTEH